MLLGDRLKAIRADKDITLKTVANFTDLSISYLSDIERGAANPTLHTLGLIAYAYNMSVLDVLEGVDFAGETTDARLPSGLSELQTDPEYSHELTDAWLKTLSRIEMNGKQPQTKRDWLELYLHLRRIIEGD